jgi:hypothetical protein
MDKKIIKSKIYLVMLKNYFRAKLIHGKIILLAKIFFKEIIIQMLKVCLRLIILNQTKMYLILLVKFTRINY